MRTVLLTGASTGVGLAIAHQLLPRDYRLILTARTSSLPRFSDAGIEEGERVHLRGLDVTQADERAQVVQEADARWGGVDVLINNAGIAYRSVVEHVTEADLEAQMEVNFRAPMELARLVLPGMRARGRGRIVNISSVSGMMAMPTMSAYSASKFALEGATEALWYEVRPWNVHVTLVQPGFINSDGFEKVRMTRLSQAGRDRAWSAYYAHYRHMEGFVSRIMRSVPSTPESVARKVRRVLERRYPPLRQPATLDARVFYMLRRWMPRRIYHWALYRSLPKVKQWGPNASLPPPKHSTRPE